MKKIFKFGLTACLATAFVFAGCKKDDDDSKFAVTLSANNAEWGAVAGGGEFADGTEIQIMATANSGYHFEKWSDDDTNNPRTITVTKNIALIAVFAEGNGSGTVNGGGNNNQGNTGIATGDILPKKVTKIIEKDVDDTKTYLFDIQGRIISKTYEYNGKVDEIRTYTYTDNNIVRKKSGESENDGWIFNVESGRIVSDVLTEGEVYVYPTEYAYSSDGYLISMKTTSQNNKDFYDNLTFTVDNGNIVACDRHYNEKGDSKITFTFGDKLNNLNVDIALLVLDFDLQPLSGYYGKRCKNLPSVGTYSRGSSGRTYEYSYTYDGEYLTKVFLLETESDGTSENSWEIFYE